MSWLYGERYQSTQHFDEMGLFDWPCETWCIFSVKEEELSCWTKYKLSLDCTETCADWNGSLEPMLGCTLILHCYRLTCDYASSDKQQNRHCSSTWSIQCQDIQKTMDTHWVPYVDHGLLACLLEWCHVLHLLLLRSTIDGKPCIQSKTSNACGIFLLFVILQCDVNCNFSY